MIIGLTGQSGAGKTTFSDTLRKQEGFAVIDCDKVAKQVTADGSLCNMEIRKHFPEAVSEDGVLDRRKMAETVFSDMDKLRLYEGIIYPYITQVTNDLISLYSSNGYQAIVLDAPTLFEAGMEGLCDIVIGVTAAKDIRKKRIMARDGIDDALIEKRFSSQRDEEFFIKRCGYIISNNAGEQELISEILKITETIRTMING